MEFINGEHKIEEGAHITSSMTPEDIKAGVYDKANNEDNREEKEEGVSTEEKDEKVEYSGVPVEEQEVDQKKSILPTVSVILTLVVLLTTLITLTKTESLIRHITVKEQQESMQKLTESLQGVGQSIAEYNTTKESFEALDEEMKNLSDRVDELESRVEKLEKATDADKGIWVEEEEAHGWIGIEMADGQVEGIVDVIHGAVIVDVIKGSPAEKAGLKKNTLITEINGVEVSSMRDTKMQMSQIQPGQTVEITLTEVDEEGYYKKRVFHVTAVSKDEISWEKD